MHFWQVVSLSLKYPGGQTQPGEMNTRFPSQLSHTVSGLVSQAEQLAIWHVRFPAPRGYLYSLIDWPLVKLIIMRRSKRMDPGHSLSIFIFFTATNLINYLRVLPLQINISKIHTSTRCPSFTLSIILHIFYPNFISLINIFEPFKRKLVNIHLKFSKFRVL